jgi:hypothetical protein
VIRHPVEKQDLIGPQPQDTQDLRVEPFEGPPEGRLQAPVQASSPPERSVDKFGGQAPVPIRKGGTLSKPAIQGTIGKGLFLVNGGENFVGYRPRILGTHTFTFS